MAQSNDDGLFSELLALMPIVKRRTQDLLPEHFPKLIRAM